MSIHRTTPRQPRAMWLAALCLFTFAVADNPAWAQQAATGRNAAGNEDAEVVEDTRPLYQREPFDLIKLDEMNKGEVIKVVPLPRPLPKDRGSTATLRFQRFDQRNRQLEVPWRNVVEVTLFEEMVLAEARQLTSDQKFDEAFPRLDFLLSRYPNLPGLDDALNVYLLTNAAAAFREQKYIEVFSMLEELHKSSPRFRSEDVLKGLDRAANALLKQHMDAGNIHAAQMLLARLEGSYKDTQLTAIATWRGELSNMASVKLDAAQKALDNDQMREAYKLVQEMMEIYPKVPGGIEVAQQIANKYPLIYVGISQPATVFEPDRIDNWAARRSGRLLHRMLLEFLQPGGEGGQYSFPLGTITLSEDRQQLMLQVASTLNGVPTPLSGYELSHRLVELATIGHPDYTPAWASLVANINVSNVFDVYVDLRRPHVLPQAMLMKQFNDDRSSDGRTGSGPYTLAAQLEDETQFLLKPDYPFARPGQPKEIVERHFEDSQEAIQALLRGEVDILDQLYPADAVKLRSRSDLEVRQYAMPQVHLLVPVSDHPYLQNRNFRRALVYAIDRQSILKRELLNNQDISGCRVISGPFPAGRSSEDPLGYAYDERIEPLPYNPRLGFALALTAQFEIISQAEKRGEKMGELIEGIEMPQDEDELELTDAEKKQRLEEAASIEKPPAPKPLVIGYPAGEIARVACQAIEQQLTSVKIPCKLRELPPGMTSDPENQCDLIYVTAAVWEPIVDARRLLGPDGVAGSNNPYINLMLRKLESARSWREVREALHDLHARVSSETIVLPLWQMTDHFAYRRGVRGIGDGPVSLYQDVEQWSISPRIKTN